MTSAHVIDSAFLGDLFGGAELRAVFADTRQLQCWLDFEAALARAEAAEGIIPQAAADEIARVARVELIDLAALREGVNFTGHPLISLVRQLAGLCAGDAGRYVHWGATTQDVTDTGLMLQAQAAYRIILRDLRELASALAELAGRERDTLQAGRTHGQHATPITFGFKVAVWLDETLRHIERLEQAAPRVFVGEFAGASTTLASLGAGPARALAVQRRLMTELGLGVPVIGWHAARDRYAELGLLLAAIAGMCGKIAHEVIMLQKSEVMELEEPHHHGKVGSSTMPHKRNPMGCEGIMALSRLARSLVLALLESAATAEHERDWAAVHTEWAAMPEICITAGAAVSQTRDVIRGLHVYRDRMRANVDALHGLILSEAVMLALGEHIGRQVAHDVVYEAAMAAFEQRRPLAELLLADPRVAAHLTTAEINDLLRPEAYTGLAGLFVDRVLAAAGEA
ncbi:MAG: 3-carboxy-cis,cis-muconate cycloisomerase [Chloroflexi bacterium ADurb.Bin325]|nr:MAG: 3-carboxy-cis,cis-muconate cycloisomerase [Chloroflexi bacterium ADurb.Bin325]